MMTRSIQAPGFEFREIDNSAYNKTVDYSLPNAPVCLIAGYANEGIDYVPQYINSLNTLNFLYGYPTNDEERYFYNGIVEILNNHGICIAAKIPYLNEQKQRYSYVDYKLTATNDLSNIGLSAINKLDNSLNKCLMITYDDTTALSRLASSELYDLRSGKSKLPNNTLRIVDISHSQYDVANFNCVSSVALSTYTNDCLGILPIITTPVNAMCFQDLINDEDLKIADKENIMHYNNVSDLKLCKLKDTKRLNIDLRNFEDNALYSFSSESKYETTVSKKTTELFPKLYWRNNRSDSTINYKYNKCVGIVVLKMYIDKGNDNRINYGILESFVGNLVKEDTKSDIPFIDDVVNSTSLYINVITNIDTSKLNTVDIVGMQNLTCQSLGFYTVESDKKIVADSTLDDIKTILEKLNNTRLFPIDVVIDAGISNIALKYMKSVDSRREYQYYDGNVWNQTLTGNVDVVNWHKAIKIFDNFCHHDRGDCMLIADCLKSFSMNDNEKIVSYLNTNSVKNHILPKLKYLPTINSSYSAGYCNWVRTYDYYSNAQFWAPPSIKVIKSYIYCSTYKHTWDAPAGVQNGTIYNATDISFNPTVSEAESLYVNNWNYLANYPTYGTIIDGLKTFQSELTALDRVNVRRLMLYIERQISELCRKYLYLLNTAVIRTKVKTDIDVFLTSIQNGSGISEYAVICDDTINTPETIDRNELHVKIAIKPVKTIEFIIVSFILTNLNASVIETIS